MANYTAIEIHPWLSRIDKPDQPDFAMIDLDPSAGASWSQVKETALIVRDILHGLDLEGAARLCGARFARVSDARSLRAELQSAPGLRLIEARTDRTGNVEQPTPALV